MSDIPQIAILFGATWVCMIIEYLTTRKNISKMIEANVYVAKGGLELVREIEWLKAQIKKLNGDKNG